MKAMPTVSVIIPTYNRCDTLKKAIQSVFDQTYKDFEIIVVNDGSTDQTAEYLATIQNDRFNFVSFDSNRGGNHARNEGVNRAQGEYLAFLDDDDLWAPNKLEEQIKCLSDEKVEVCFTGLNVYTSKEIFIKYIFKKAKHNNLYKSIMNDNFIGGSSSIVVKREKVLEIQGFDTNLPALQDWDLLIRLFKIGCRLKGINKPLVSYYIVDVNRSITCSHKNYKKAADYLLIKYREDPYIHLLKRRLKIIEIKRLFKSKRFFLNSITYYSNQLFNRRK